MSLGRGVRPPLRMWQRGHRERLGARPATAENSATFAQRASHHPDSNGLRGQHISCAGRESLLCVDTEAAKISRGADMLECMVQVTDTGGIEPFRLILRAVRKGRGRRTKGGHNQPFSLFSFVCDEFPVKSWLDARVRWGLITSGFVTYLYIVTYLN